MGGETDKAKGRVKQAAGDLTDDEELQRQGERDETAGKAKETIDKVRDKAREAIDSAREKFD